MGEIMKRILTEPKLLTLLTAFCHSESSAENISFIKAVKEYQLIQNEPQMIEKAKRICMMYLQRNSFNELNISDDCKRGIEIAIGDGDIDVTLFDGAYKEVCYVMGDTISRFCNSEKYLKYMNKAYSKKSPSVPNIHFKDVDHLYDDNGNKSENGFESTPPPKRRVSYESGVFRSGLLKALMRKFSAPSSSIHEDDLPEVLDWNRSKYDIRTERSTSTDSFNSLRTGSTNTPTNSPNNTLLDSPMIGNGNMSEGTSSQVGHFYMDSNYIVVNTKLPENPK